ncbi:UNVERIFIED_CONTAM: hypothetical protein HDU68_000403, partial [Siphonaria sp. JEL0065]
MYASISDEPVCSASGKVSWVRGEASSVQKRQQQKSSPTLNDSDQEDNGPSQQKKKRSNSPLPTQAAIPNRQLKIDDEAKASSSSSRNNTPSSNQTYPLSRESTPTVPAATISRSHGPNSIAPSPVVQPSIMHPMFAGKTKPGAPLMAKNLSIQTAGKMPVNGYGKVPRVLTPTATAMLAGIGGGQQNG